MIPKLVLTDRREEPEQTVWGEERTRARGKQNRPDLGR